MGNETLWYWKEVDRQDSGQNRAEYTGSDRCQSNSMESAWSFQ